MDKIIIFIKNRFHIFLIVVLLVAAMIFLSRFSFRLDLTANKVFTLSEVSKSLVRDLKDPLRIKVFISKNLPPPLNDLPTALEDILIEYQEAANGNFIFTFYDVTESEGADPKVEANIKLANDYGINANQVQTLEKDQLQLIKVYAGIVIEYGNLIDRIPFISSTAQLEYRLTTILDKMHKKLNSLLALETPISARLYLNDDFVQVSPLFQIQGLSGVVDTMKEVFKKVNQENYGKVDFEVRSEITSEDFAALNQNKVRIYPWTKFKSPDGKTIPAGQGVAGLMFSYNNKVEWVELLNPQASLQIGSQGLQQVVRYVLLNLNNYENTVDGIIDSLLDINDYIAYLDDKGTVSVVGTSGNSLFQQNSGGEGAHFYNLLGENYTVESIGLEELSTKYKTLIIGGAKEEFSDYDLFLIDQFLMQGKSLFILQDTLTTQPSLPGAQSLPKWEPVNNGLDKLLEHYGIRIRTKYVMDKKSYVSRGQAQGGGASEQQIYFAPLIQDQNINHDFTPLKHFKTFIGLEMSPLDLIDERLEGQKVTATKLFSSSIDSWTQTGEPSLIPAFIELPKKVEDYQKSDLAYLIEGEFKSYFADKPIPTKPEEDGVDNERKVTTSTDTFSVKDADLISSVSQPAKIIVMGSSAMIKNNLIDEQGQGINAKLAINLVDYLSDREDWTIMRSKSQRVVPLEPYNPDAPGFSRWITHRGVLKWFNMLGLPLVVVLIGFFVYIHRSSRRKRIADLFMGKNQ